MNHDIERRGRIWAEVDLDALVHNYRSAQKAAGDAKTLAVLKANAYGHGAVEAARALSAAGADYFAVAAPCEAVELREAGIGEPIILLGIAPDSDIAQLAELNIELACPSVDHARKFAALAGKTVRVHIQLDTGMSRLGFDTVSGPAQAAEQIAEAASLSGLEIAGMFTHFCVSDTREEDEYTLRQFALFCETRDELQKRGISIPLCHCANSAAILRFPQMRLDMVREGIILYGVAPDDWMDGMGDLRPVMSVRTRVMQVKEIKAGTTVGYGRTWRAERDTRVATLGIGYADGYPRGGSNKHELLVNGKRVRQIGRVCMDITMIDVTGLDVQQGDVVTVLGTDGGACITASDVAKTANTIAHEFLCNVNRRVPRIYLKDGKPVSRMGSI